MKARVAVDSNLLVHAVEIESPKHGAAKELLARLAETESVVVSVQNLAEFSRVVTEKVPRPLSAIEAQTALDAFLEVFSVVSYDAAAVRRALGYAEAGNTYFFDALLAATMLENGIDTIYTENTQDFQKIPGIKAVNPFD